jgi:hypothetical protein
MVIVAAEVGAAAFEAVRVNWASWPGATERVAGLAVTPAGRPLSETLTGLAKPLMAAAVTVSDPPPPPLCRAMVLGAALIVKSGASAAETVRAATAVCEIEPAEPVTVTVAPEVSVADLEAVRVN